MKWFKRAAHEHGLAVLTAFCPGNAVALQLRPAGTKFQVTAFAWLEVPVATADVLRLLAEQAGLRRAPLIALLPPDSYQVLLLEAPGVPDDELRSAVRWKLKDMLDYHIDDAVFELLKVPASGEGRLPYLYAITVPARVVREMAALYQESGLALQVIDVDETAQRHIAARLEPPGYAVGLLHVQGERGLLTFTFEGELVLARRIDLRGAPDDERAERVVLEVQRSVDYFDRHFHALPLSKLYLAPLAGDDALYRQLHENLSLSVDRLDLSLIFDFGEHAMLQQPAVQAQVFHALGAAMREWA